MKYQGGNIALQYLFDLCDLDLGCDVEDNVGRVHNIIFGGSDWGVLTYTTGKTATTPTDTHVLPFAYSEANKEATKLNSYTTTSYGVGSSDKSKNLGSGVRDLHMRNDLSGMT